MLACKTLTRASGNSLPGVKEKTEVFAPNLKLHLKLLVQDALDNGVNWMTTATATAILDRTDSAVVAHAKKCKKQCRVFAGHVQTVKNAHPTEDPKEGEFERAALAIYND